MILVDSSVWIVADIRMTHRPLLDGKARGQAGGYLSGPERAWPILVENGLVKAGHRASGTGTPRSSQPGRGAHQAGAMTCR